MRLLLAYRRGIKPLAHFQLALIFQRHPHSWGREREREQVSVSEVN